MDLETNFFWATALGKRIWCIFEGISMLLRFISLRSLNTIGLGKSEEDISN